MGMFLSKLHAYSSPGEALGVIICDIDKEDRNGA